jgi:hypothetical protein
VRDESVDLIDLDPPFSSNASYNVLFKAPTGFVHFGIDVDFFPSCMDLVLAILFDVFAKEVFSIEMVFLLCEGGARRVERGSCRDHSEYETPINHELVSFGRDSVAHNVAKFSAGVATAPALSFRLNP